MPSLFDEDAEAPASHLRNRRAPPKLEENAPDPPKTPNKLWALLQYFNTCITFIRAEGWTDYWAFNSARPTKRWPNLVRNSKLAAVFIVVVTFAVIGVRWGGKEARRRAAVNAFTTTALANPEHVVEVTLAPSEAFRGPNHGVRTNADDADLPLPPLRRFHHAMLTPCVRVNTDNLLYDFDSEDAVTLRLLIRTARHYCEGTGGFLGFTPKNINRTECLLYMADGGDGTPTILLNPAIASYSGENITFREGSTLFPQRQPRITSRPKSISMLYDEVTINDAGTELTVSKNKMKVLNGLAAFVAHSCYSDLQGTFDTK